MFRQGVSLNNLYNGYILWTVPGEYDGTVVWILTVVFVNVIQCVSGSVWMEILRLVFVHVKSVSVVLQGIMWKWLIGWCLRYVFGDLNNILGFVPYSRHAMIGSSDSRTLAHQTLTPVTFIQNPSLHILKGVFLKTWISVSILQCTETINKNSYPWHCTNLLIFPVYMYV